MKENKKEILAEKETKYLYIMIISDIVMIILSILMILAFIKTEELVLVIFIILYLIVVILFTGKVILNILLPKIPIHHDGLGIYINKPFNKIIYVHYNDIEYVNDIKVRFRYKEYSFGKLIIKTKNEKYKIGVIKNVSIIAEFIQKKIKWKQYVTTIRGNGILK